MKRDVRRVSRQRPRRRGARWIFVLTGTLSVPAGSSAVVAASASDVREDQAPASESLLTFSIAPGPLDAALADFERITGVKVVLAAQGIASVQSSGVTGSFTAGRAMEQLLRGTLVRATFSGDTVRLEIRGASEVVDVEGAAPRAQSLKYTEPLRDTPQTFVVIPQKVFLEQNATSLREVLRNTPGITMSIGEGGSGGTSSGDNVLIRGFSARNDIYVDGVRDVGLVNRDTFDTESVEVAKGPTSVTGGRGATGGSINLVSKAAGAQDSATFRVSGGSADFKRTTLDVNHKLSDSMAVRVNGMWQDTGYPGRDVAKYRSWGIAPSLVAGLNGPTRVTLNYSRMKQDNIPDWGIPTLLPDVAIARGITVNDLDFSNFYGIASRDYEKTTSDLATGIVDHRFNQTLGLRNLTRYGKNYRDAVLTPPRPATTLAGQGPEDPGYDPTIAQLRRTDTKYQHRNDQLTTNQTDLTADFGTGTLRHKADVGLEIARDHQPTYAFTDLFTKGRPPVDDLFNPTPYASYTPSYAKTGASTNAHATTVGAYAFDTVEVNAQWHVDLGVRWDRVDVDYKNVAATGAITNFGRTDRAVTGRSGLVYKPVEKASIYAAYSTSFAPSFDGTLGLTLAATGANSQALAPERSRNVEAGTKWEVAHDVLLTAAVFEMQKTNAKTVDLTGATVLAGDQQVKGVEFSMSGEITEQWTVFGGLSLMDGTVKNSGVPSEIGQELAYVPHASLNLWTTYHLPNKLTVGGGTSYEEGHYFNQTGGFQLVSGRSDPRYAQNAAAIQALTRYWLFNATASYLVNRHLTLQVNATNLANEKYADRAYDRHFLPGPGRQLVISPVISF